MAGRELVFADPRIIELVTEKFIAVTGDDWYQRRREDAEGKFFRSVADQGPRKGDGGSTRQGIYCFTASGKLLTYRNHHDPDVMLGELKKALAGWQRLPESERKAGGVKVPDLDEKSLDKQFVRTLPKGAIAVTVFTRNVERDKDGKLATCSIKTKRTNTGNLASQDHLWITAEECRRLAPGDVKKGQTFPLPNAIAERIARFHLVDNTRGEPPFWKRDEIRASKLTLTVFESSDKLVRLKLEGSVLVATDADLEKAERGYDAAVSGQIDFDRKKSAITRFDVAVLGEVWGDATYTRGARPGRNPLGIVMELAKGDQPADRVPPQAMRGPWEYWTK